MKKKTVVKDLKKNIGINLDSKCMRLLEERAKKNMRSKQAELTHIATTELLREPF
jgi:hypothetical protein